MFWKHAVRDKIKIHNHFLTADMLTFFYFAILFWKYAAIYKISNNNIFSHHLCSHFIKTFYSSLTAFAPWSRGSSLNIFSHHLCSHFITTFYNSLTAFAPWSRGSSLDKFSHHLCSHFIKLSLSSSLRSLNGHAVLLSTHEDMLPFKYNEIVYGALQ